MLLLVIERLRVLAGLESVLSEDRSFYRCRTAVISLALVLGVGCKDESGDTSDSKKPVIMETFISQTNIGKAHFETRNFEKALAAFELAWEANPDEPAARVNLALALMKIQGRREESLDHLNAAVSAEPDSAAPHYLVGLCLFYAGPEQIPARVKALERAIELDSEIANVRWQLGNAYKDAGRNQDAYEQFKECVRLDPLHWAGFNSLKGAANLLDKPDEAKRAYDTMLKIKALRGTDPRPPDELERCRHTMIRTPYPTSPPEEGITVTFVDVTEEAGLGMSAGTANDRSTSDTGVVSIIDFNDDGRWDLLAGDRRGRPWLFRNVGDGRFEPDGGPSRVLPGVAGTAIAVDFGNDGRDDL
ncbi:MAG: tetratricopeptide repeat protein, partial [Planctomycetota bacterium]|nr:tetratricopeptide repeat protein [Planctomycetota bacterium]